MKLFYPLCIALLVCFSSCESDDPETPERICQPASDGGISAAINATNWTGCEFKAVYYRKDHQLSVSAVDKRSTYELRFSISLDSVSPLKNYLINSNSNNGLAIIEQVGQTIYGYECDYLKPTIGGGFNLTSFDTATGRLSASFRATGFDYENNRTIDIENGVMMNVKLNKSDSSQRSRAYLRAKINGVDWYSLQVGGLVTLHIGSPLYSFVNVQSAGVPADYYDGVKYIDGYPVFGGGVRGLSFFLPLALSPGTYPLGGHGLYQQTIADQRFLFNLWEFQNDPNNSPGIYYPQPGSTFILTSLDTAGRHLEARFSMQAKSPAGGIYNITEGELFLPYWRKMFEF